MTPHHGPHARRIIREHRARARALVATVAIGCLGLAVVLVAIWRAL